MKSIKSILTIAGAVMAVIGTQQFDQLKNLQQPRILKYPRLLSHSAVFKPLPDGMCSAG